MRRYLLELLIDAAWIIPLFLVVSIVLAACWIAGATTTP